MATPSAIPEGRVGNLTPQQETKLKEIWQKILAIETGTVTVDGDAAATEFLKKNGKEVARTFWNATVFEDPDAIALRFLRARQFDITKSFAMMANALKWRVEFKVDEITAAGEPDLNTSLPGFVDQMRSGKAYLHGNDKLYRPVFYIHVKLHNPKGQPAASLEKFTIYSIETGRAFLQSPLNQCCLVFDLTSFGLKNMDWNFIMFLTKTFEAYYPETLGLILVHNAPWVFQGIWRVLAPLLDPVVRSKIEFTVEEKKGGDKRDIKSRKERYIRDFIEDGHLPKSMGGTEEWSWEYSNPTPLATKKSADAEGKKDAEATITGLFEKFSKQTADWIKPDASADLAAQRRKTAIELKVAGIEKLAYINPLSVYHEKGYIKDNGQIEWDYQSESGKVVYGTSLEEYKAQLA